MQRPVLPLWLLFICAAALPAGSVRADEFDDHSVYWLKKGIEGSAGVEQMTMQDGLRLKPVDRRISSPCLVIRTDEDNWAKAIVSWGFRKSGEGRIPVVVIERYVTARGDRPNLTAATGRDVMLFPGFAFNFDIGQIVPAGQGEDLLCGDQATLKPAAGAALFGLNGSALPPAEASKYPLPTAHEGVLPTDFAGRWQVRIDGRWDGVWHLDVDGRRVYGRFVSSDTRSSYDIEGRIGALPHHVKLDIELANAAQTIDAYLWTRDKAAMAGVVTIAERKVGFYALRAADESVPSAAAAPAAESASPKP